MFDTIINNNTYKEVLKDSFGGIMYNVANEGKYNTDELQQIVDKYEKWELNGIDGIMKGVFNFLNINYK